MVLDFVLKEPGKQRMVTVYSGEEEVASIQPGKDFTYTMASKSGEEWALGAKVHGEVRPFSMTVTRLKTPRDAGSRFHEEVVLIIRNHLFLHGGKFYLLGGTPEGVPPREFLLGSRYICRLDNFPFSRLDEVDHETTSKLARFRGEPVGELDGLGKQGHRVKLMDELQDIGLPLAASCYLLYSTA